MPQVDLDRSRSPKGPQEKTVRFEDTPELERAAAAKHQAESSPSSSIIHMDKKPKGQDEPSPGPTPGASCSASHGPALPLVGGTDPTGPPSIPRPASPVPEAPAEESKSPRPSPEPALPTGNNDDTEEYEDDPGDEGESTKEYEDADDNELNFAKANAARNSLMGPNIVNASLMESQLYLAIADAERVLLDYRLQEAGTMPWSPQEAMFRWEAPVREPQCFYFSLSEQKCYSVSSDDILTPEELIQHWDLVNAADREEIRSFVTHTVFKLALACDDRANNRVDAIWVRRWKDRRKLLLKCRLCGRGYLDKQKASIDRHSSTASRLSHRLACSQAVIHELDIESIDISTAFLQGLNFSEILAKAKELGLEVQEKRQVWLVPPANVWRHLREIPESRMKVQDEDIQLFLLKLLKAMYGLVDGPSLPKGTPALSLHETANDSKHSRR